MDDQVMTKGLLRARIARGQREHGTKWDASGLESATALHHYYESDERVEVDIYGDGAVIERGRVSTTTGWKPAFLLMHRRSDHGSSTLLDGRAKVLRVISASRRKETS
jgi:hypothetical protein